MKHTPWKALLLAAALLATACDYVDPKSGASTPPPSAAGTGGTGSGPATFQQVYSQILAPKCVACHSGSTAPNLSSWASFAQDTRYVIPGNPGQSDVYVQVSSGNMPKSGAALTQGELSLLSDWITQGAQNN
jgi:hypothetical protein